MRITADTNLLLRALLADDEAQTALAAETLKGAELVAVSLASLCEVAWVLRRLYRASTSDIADALRRVLALPNVATDRPAAEAGLALLEVGGGFADGVIAFEGARQGGETFVSFDRNAVKLLTDLGQPARLLGA